MAVSAVPSPRELTPAEAALIPSRALPIGSQLSHLVQEFTHLSIQLFTLLSSSPTGSAAPTAPIYAALATVDDKLARLLVLHAEHQAHQTRIDALVAQLGTLDTTWHASASTLRACTHALAPVVESGARDRAAIAAARTAQEREGALSPANLLAYARLLAPFTSAPPSSLLPAPGPGEDHRQAPGGGGGGGLKGVGATDPTGRTLPPGAIPPFPTEAVMRRGRLQFGREGLLQGLGETNEVGGRREGADAPRADDAATTSRPDAATRLEQEARAHDAASAVGAGEGAAGTGTGTDDDEFEFDLDLNPDL